MSERLCNLFEECQTPDAPLCPIQESTVRYGIWYPDEPICRAKKFQDLSWIKKQKKIAKLKLNMDDGFFTIRMLNQIQVVPRSLKGADPADSNAEMKWLQNRTEKQVKSTYRKLHKRAVDIEDPRARMLL
jgi:hypothetical protein